MSDQLPGILFWLIMLIPVGIFARQIKQVRRGARRKLGGTAVFFAYSLLPVLAYVLVFLSLVGIEELTTLSLVSEGLSRTLVLVIGIGLGEVLLLTVIFAIVAGILG